MIRYSLKCDDDHPFEGWFRNSEDFERQRKRGLVTCPECGVAGVAKALMAPNVVTGSKRGQGQPESDVAPEAGNVVPRAPAGAGAVAPAASMAVVQKAELHEKVLTAMRALRREVVEKSEYVGPKFAEEARRINDDEAEERSIYGEASLEEARELLEDGIEVMPLPRLPEDEN